MPKQHKKNNSSPVSLIETIRIPAWSELEVMAQVENKNLHQEMLLEPTNVNRIPVRVARGLVLPTTKGVPVRLLNTGTEPVTVHKGTTLGIVERPQPLQFVHKLTLMTIRYKFVRMRSQTANALCYGA